MVSAIIRFVKRISAIIRFVKWDPEFCGSLPILYIALQLHSHIKWFQVSAPLIKCQNTPGKYW